MDSKYSDPPSAKVLDEGYNQTYIILEQSSNSRGEIDKDGDSKNERRDDQNNNAERENHHEVLFRCGNWCYKGLVQFNDLKINLEDVPIVIPTLQRQQGSLRYFCTAKSVPTSSDYSGPMRYMEKALDFIAQELTSENVEKELSKMSSIYSWIEDDSAATYFELSISVLPECMEKVRLIASKTYTQGLVIIAIYYSSTIYCVLLPGEGDQPLLDVRFPDVSKHNQGVMLNSYNHSEFRKLTLWHNISAPNQGGGIGLFKKDLPKLKTVDLSHKNYEQTYVILHSNLEASTGQLSSYHDVMFRFGSWCYSGRVQLTAQLCLYDVPYVIPALRMQQSRLDFVCDVSALPVTSPFAFVMQYMRRAAVVMETVLLQNEDRVSDIIQQNGSSNSEASEEGAFFEFSLAFPEDLHRQLSNVEMIVSKTYHPSGIVTVAIFFQNTLYVCLQDTAKGEHPLLDSRFPMLHYQVQDANIGEDSHQSVGYVLRHYERGIEQWPELRKLTLWITPSSTMQETPRGALFTAEAKSVASSDHGLKSDGAVKLEVASTIDEKLETKAIHSDPSSFQGHRKQLNSVPTEPIPSADSKQPNQSSHHLSPIGAGGFKQALPHHIPKLSDPLANKIESIRNAMGEEGLLAPWDLRGRPLGKLGDNK